MERSAKYWISKLGLLPHPEGGYFKEVYRDHIQISQTFLEPEFKGNRNISTAIYYLLEKGDYSCFHRIKSDELWHFYDGSPVNIYYLTNGQLTTLKLGLSLEDGEHPLCVVPKKTWFAAELSSDSKFALMGCTVAPGFNFEDFEMATSDDLKNYIAIIPEKLKRLISK